MEREGKGWVGTGNGGQDGWQSQCQCEVLTIVAGTDGPGLVGVAPFPWGRESDPRTAYST
jgi:hypothetical protein